MQDHLDCAQGVLSLTPTSARTGGTTVVARSHLLHGAALRTLFPREELAADPRLNWHVLTPQQREWLLAQPRCALVHVATSPGDLLLWDSRTIHCGRQARDPQPPDGWRFATYIAMWPAARLTAADRAAKRRAMGIADEGAAAAAGCCSTSSSGAAAAGFMAESTTHWPDGRRAGGARSDAAPGATQPRHRRRRGGRGRRSLFPARSTA